MLILSTRTKSYAFDTTQLKDHLGVLRGRRRGIGAHGIVHMRCEVIIRIGHGLEAWRAASSQRSLLQMVGSWYEAGGRGL